MRNRAVLLAALGLFGCANAAAERGTPRATDAAGPSQQASGDAGPGCFAEPQTYLEIINACADAEAIDKSDDLSLMNLADGGLRPVP